MCIEYPNDPYLQQDLEWVSEIFSGELALREAAFLITGATGLVGLSLIRSLLCLNRETGGSLRILAAVRSLEKAENRFGNLYDRPELEFVCADITKPFDISAKVDYVIHCAAVTASKMMVDKPVDTIMTGVIGTKNVLDLAVRKRVKSFVYVSSMEVYGNCRKIEHEITESDQGYLDPLAVRSSYSESKRLCENICIAYQVQYGVPVKIARLAQTFGAGVPLSENRFFAQLAKSVMTNRDIVLHTTGESEGNYCYLRDTVSGLLTILLYGQEGEAYNVANPQAHMTIRELAELVAERIAGNRIRVVFDIPKTNLYGYAPDTKMKLNSQKLQSIGWKPEVSLEEAFNRMISSMRCQ